MPRASNIHVKRIYEPPDPHDGKRVLVDRLWPRGLAKEDAQVDEWLRDLAPSGELRKWFGHDPERWPVFQERYTAELDTNPEAWLPLLDWAQEDRVTLLYAAQDTKHNNAVALKAYLERHLGQA